MSLDERMDDLDLLRNWRAGDARAGDRLLARHFGAVYRFFRTKAGPSAESLAQATFVACCEAEPPAQAVGFKASLFSAARRQLLDHLERVSGRAIAATTTTLARLAPALVDDGLHTPLRQLPIDVQIAVELHHWERLSVADVGYVVGLGAGAVKGRLARVRKQLEARVLHGPAALLDADGQRAWASVRARMFEAPRAGLYRNESAQAAAPRTTVLSNRPSAVAE